MKFTDYEAHGVREYWIIDPETRIVEQFLDGDSGFQLQLKSSSGQIRSRVIEGFAIPVEAIFDREANLTALRGLV